MHSYIDCVHCYLKQTVSCLQHAGVDEETQYKVIYEMMDFVKTLDKSKSPAENSTLVVHRTYEAIGTDDPYGKVKRQSNDLAIALYPRLEKIIASSKDRLYTALKISVAGNIIDLGINRSYNIEEGLRHSLENGFSIDHYCRFLKRFEEAQEIIIIGDNAGEIVFDRLLAEEMIRAGKKITYVVKSGPVLNDATIKDSIYTGIDTIAKVLTTGSNCLGLCMDMISDELKKQLENAPLIISKGQANFETLEHEERYRGKIFFLLKLKCEEVARAAGARPGDVVFFTR